MQSREVDVAIIGAGTAGLNAIREATRANKRWALIEDGPYGTTCARVGCMPSKLLISAGDASHAVHAANEFGVRVARDAVRIDGKAVFERVRRERDRFVSGVVKSTEALPDDHRIRGRARFVAPGQLHVDEQLEVRARTVVVATGSSPWIPPPFEPVRKHVLTSDTVFELPSLPGSLAVIGTGIIGLELGQAFHRLGVETTFFNPFDVVGMFSDPEVRRSAKDVLGSELQLRLQTEVLEARVVTDGICIRWKDADEREHESVFEQVLVAAGRRPNTSELALDNANVRLHKNGAPVHDRQTLQCGEEPVFAAGDVSGDQQLLHEAADEGCIAGYNAAHFPEMKRARRRTPLAVAFTDPQMAVVGTGFDGLATDDFVVGCVSYADQGRARVIAQARGIVRIYAARDDGRLLGAEMFGPRVEHTAHLLAWAIQQGMRVQEALRMPFYHPVIEEGIRTALRDLGKQLQLTAECPVEDQAVGPGM